MKQLICIQCLWCLTLIVVDCARVGPTESERQSAFEQLLSGKTGRLRMLSATTTTGLPPLSLPTTPVTVLTDEEAKRHDRRHAVLPPKKHNHKKNHSKRQHHGHHAGGSVGRHVCTHEETVTRPIRVVESYCKPAYKSFTQRCSNGTLCTAFRVQYDTIYRTVVKYQTTIQTKHACCPGWTHHSSKHITHGCLQAVCSKACKNGGTCIKPNICSCPPGYTGSTCESDLDECSSNNHRCQQLCTNSVGSYQCGCHDGFQLQQDNKTCKFRLELVPEFQNFLANYESLSRRLAVLEQEPRQHSNQASPPIDATDYQSTIANMTQHIVSLEEKISKLQSETNMLIANSTVDSNDSSNSDSLTSLSEQVAILEERLADCTCTTPVDNKVKTRS